MDTHRPGRSLPTTPKPSRSDTSRASATELRAWCHAAASGDVDAFARLYTACRGWVLARCRSRLPVHDAEDVCAEVIASAWRHLASGRVIDHPLAWLATVTRHAIIDHHKRAHRTIPAGDLTADADTVRIPVPDPAPGPAELTADIDVAPLVRAWLAQLSPAAHAAVIGHMSIEDQIQTSARTGCSLPALRSSLYRARRQLRVRLAGAGFAFPSARRC